jgi:hypothetical protein
MSYKSFGTTDDNLIDVAPSYGTANDGITSETDNLSFGATRLPNDLSGRMGSSNAETTERATFDTLDEPVSETIVRFFHLEGRRLTGTDARLEKCWRKTSAGAHSTSTD